MVKAQAFLEAVKGASSIESPETESTFQVWLQTRLQIFFVPVLQEIFADNNETKKQPAPLSFETLKLLGGYFESQGIELCRFKRDSW